MPPTTDNSAPIWPPPLADVRHGIAAPVGAVRIRRAGRWRTRQIKVRLDGPAGGRWMKLARYWWITHKGPVPEGMRVCHVDGDQLNDDPANYILMTAGDVIACYHMDHPEWSEKQHRRCAAARGQHNRDHWRVESLRRWFTDRWYPVDLGERAIINAPMRRRADVYLAYLPGIPSARAARNGRGLQAAALGWPGLFPLSAAVMAVLADARGEMATPALWRGVCDLMDRQRWARPRLTSALLSAMVGLRVSGWMTSRRRGRRPALHAITQAGLAAREDPCPVIAVKGSKLDGPEFEGFTRRQPGGRAARRCA